MCRFIAYLGNPLVVDEVLYRPTNSLIKQSIHALESEEPLNGDGFGLGWYSHEIDSIPGLFRSIQPAWNDANLRYLASKIRTDCFFAHIRAANVGGVSQLNCHPFHFKNYLFMHNGSIGGFNKIKRMLRRKLSDPIYDWIKGQTDSEHLFGLFLDILENKTLHFNAQNAADVLAETLTKVNDLLIEGNIAEASYINGVVSDGKSMVAIRYVSDPQATPSSLYYSVGSHYRYEEGICKMAPVEPGNGNGAILIASEKLNNHKAEWQEVPKNHMLLVFADYSVSLRKII